LILLQFNAFINELLKLYAAIFNMDQKIFSRKKVFEIFSSDKSSAIGLTRQQPVRRFCNLAGMGDSVNSFTAIWGCLHVLAME
jgi:hypothetical protein